MSVKLILQSVSSVDATGTFGVRAITRSDENLLTGLDFGIISSNATLLSRDLVGSDYPDVIDASLSGDLGASVADVRSPLLPGDHQIATFYFRVQGAGEVTLTPKVYPGTIGYVTQAPDFEEHPFDAFVGVTIPEPGFVSWFLFLLILWIIGRRV